jgi:ribonucleotide reductase alpha subunit
MRKYDKFYWLTDESRTFLSRGYLSEDETAESRIRHIADTAEKYLGIEGFSNKFYDYMSRGWYSLATPIWTNFGKQRGMPISCFNSHVTDDIGGILYAQSEVGMMSKLGGGTSGYFGELRPRGAAITDNGKSTGVVHFLELFQATTNVVSQGCYDKDTEILTEAGWMPFPQLMMTRDVKVAQVHDDHSVSFTLPLDYIEYPVNEPLLHFKDSKNIDLLVTKNHNMIFSYDKKITTTENGVTSYTRTVKQELVTKRADEVPLHRDVKFLHSAKQSSGVGLTPFERLLIALQADGAIVTNYKEALKFRFAKLRKKERLEWILETAGIPYSYSFYETDQTHNFYVNVGQVLPKTFEDWVDITNVSYEWATEFLEEVSNWDSHGAPSSFLYASIIKSNVDIVQSIAALCKYKCTVTLDLREKDPNKQPIYKAYLSLGQYFGVEKVTPKEVEYEGNVYCVEVPTHRLIVRRNGHSLVCGNSARRGRMAPYLPIDHGDIMEFLEVGTDGHAIQDMNTGVVIDDYWMKEMIAGDTAKRKVWAKLLQSRKEIGYPYVMFRDNANNKAPDVFRDKNQRINSSNLCVEINLPSTPEESFTCILSSMNILHYDEWKDTDAVETMVYFLDAVASEFIAKLEAYRDSSSRDDNLVWEYMKRSHTFTRNNRALGLGVLGWVSYLQSKMIPFESKEAAKLNLEIFKTINLKGNKASKELAELFGEPENLVGYGRRNATLFAVAPTTSSAFILGQVSQSIEPPFSNCYIKDLAKVKTVIKNKYLEELLESKGHNTAEVWDIIINNDGSVLGLPDTILTAEEKAVFLTFGEINQEVVIDQASVRQDYIDQGQSINLMIPANYTAKEINALHIRAWQLGLKGLYYQHGTNAAQALLRSKNIECVACSA